MTDDTIILADDESTWPRTLLSALESRLDALRAFQLRRREIDRAAEEDVMLRIHRPANANQGVWDESLSLAQEIIQPAKIVGYHCTRLAPHEIADIYQGGLQPLTPALIDRRIEAGARAGLLTTDLANQIRAENLAAEANRTQLLWFVFCRNILTHRSGVYRLFRSWGGEAVYAEREGNEEGGALRRVGEPAIVVAAMSAREIETYCDVGKRFVTRYLAARSVPVEDGMDWRGTSLFLSRKFCVLSP